MNKEIWKPLGEWSCFVGSVLVGVKNVFLPSFALTYTQGEGYFETKKKSGSDRESPLNNSPLLTPKVRGILELKKKIQSRQKKLLK